MLTRDLEHVEELEEPVVIFCLWRGKSVQDVCTAKPMGRFSPGSEILALR